MPEPAKSTENRPQAAKLRRIDEDQAGRSGAEQYAAVPPGDFAMTRNIGRIDRFLRIIAGFALLAYAVKDGTLGPGWLGSEAWDWSRL